MDSAFNITYTDLWPDLQPDQQQDAYLTFACDLFTNFLKETTEDQAAKEISRLKQTAEILLDEFGLAIPSLLVLLLWKPFLNSQIQQEEIRNKFEPTVNELLNGLARIEHLDTTKTAIQAENFIQLIISLSTDVRLLLIKLAAQLTAIRTIVSYPPAGRLRICQETESLYGPIAHRLGLYRAKTEFEETAMKYLHPTEYKYIAKRLNETRSGREKYIRAFVDPIQSLLTKNGFACEIKGRPKSIHSIWNKMKSQGVDFDEVYDLFAIRIILDGNHTNEKSQCWQIYSLVTDYYPPNPNRLRDWISVPKPNGYESLHTTVIGPEGKWVEVQIRTRRMDQTAELGHAAHWMYKENITTSAENNWLDQLRRALTLPDLSVESGQHLAKTELYSDQIYVFTPANDLIKLQSGATILDFAFAVHTKVGYHCTGAKVNGRIVPIKHVLTNGDQVEVITSAQQKPKTDWLPLVKTSKAKARIKRALKEAAYHNADEGKETLKRKFEQWRIKYDVTTIHRLVNLLKFKDALELYQAIADNRVDWQVVRDFLKEKDPAEYIKEKFQPEKGIENFVKKSFRSEDCLIIDEQLDHIDYTLAKCCNPIFGDEVFGFVTVSGGTKIHRVNCPNARQMIKRYSYRILKVRWTDHQDDVSQYTVNISITGIDDLGILNEISKVLSGDLRVNMRAMNVESEDGFFSGRITLVVNDKHHLEVVMAKVRQVKGILNVQRSDK